MTTGSFSREQGKLRRYIFQIIRGLDFLFQAIMYCYSKKKLLLEKKVFRKSSESFESNDLNIMYVMLCAIWYHLYNLKNVKKIHGRELL